MTEERERAATPEDLTRLIVERVNARDLDALVALYEPDAVLAFPPGRQTVGRDLIRAVYEQLFAAGARFQPETPLPTLRHGDLALTATAARDEAGARAQVARRQPDGTWLRVVDRPDFRACGAPTERRCAMAQWSEFERAAPDLAMAGRALFYRGETGEAFLATVRGDAPPRIHPIWVAITDGRLCAFILPSAKRTDLERDGRFALHSYQDTSTPSEFSLRGHAKVVPPGAVRDAVARSWYFEVDETYALFEFAIESVVLGQRESVDEWPPRYSTWSAREPQGA